MDSSCILMPLVAVGPSLSFAGTLLLGKVVTGKLVPESVSASNFIKSSDCEEEHGALGGALHSPVGGTGAAP